MPNTETRSEYRSFLKQRNLVNSFTLKKDGFTPITYLEFFVILSIMRLFNVIVNGGEEFQWFGHRRHRGRRSLDLLLQRLERIYLLLLVLVSQTFDQKDKFLLQNFVFLTL